MIDNRINVVHVITGFADGGAEGVLYRLCTTDARGLHHVVSMMDEGKYGALLHERGVSVTCLDMPRGRVTIRGIWRLWSLLRKERPDVVQTWMYHADLIGGVAARLAGVKHIFWNIRNNMLDASDFKPATIMIVQLLAWISHLLPLRIVCCSKDAMRAHVEVGYNSNIMRIIPNGYDLNKVCRNDAARTRLRSEWGLNDLPVVGMVGRFDSLKHHENLFGALKEVKRRGVTFRCVLIGMGMEVSNSQLIDWLKKYDLRDEILLLGQRTDIPDVMSALDIHILSSRSESFPNVIAEAMACSTPCVSTNVGDGALIVGDTGWLVPPCDSVALANAIRLALAESPFERAVRGRSARERIGAYYSIERMVEAYHEVWGFAVQRESTCVV